MSGRRRPLAERFEERVVRIPGKDSCWEWRGAVNNRGYGEVGEGGRHCKTLLAHRVAWSLANGPIPDDMIVRHRCDNPICVRPSHLELGTQADNQRDKAVRRRGSRSKAGFPYGVSRSHGRWIA